METIIFKSSDLGLVSTLAIFFPIVDTYLEQDGRVIFSFDRTSELDQTISDHWNRNLQINSLDLLNQIQTIKHRIRDLKKGRYAYR